MRRRDFGDHELEALLTLDGVTYEPVEGYVIEYAVRRVESTDHRPHGVAYALVFRAIGGDPLVKFDNSHAVERKAGRLRRRSPTFDHWHRDERDPGRPYKWVSPLKLLEDFQREVERAIAEKGLGK
jgi:hypothetical protein